MRSNLIAGALLLAFAAGADGRMLGRLAFSPCTLAPEFALQSVEAQCATLRVPENRSAPDGRQIDLAIAWVPTEGEAAPDPVFMLAGGPGQGARDSFPSVSGAFGEILRKRDVILVDQRGTGASNPLRCRNSQGETAFTESLDDTPEHSAAFARTCAAQLEKDADLRFYTTTDAIQDLDAVRDAIGAAQINLVGISYGTRVAQQYMARYPQHTRSVILDGVVPNALVLGSEHAKNLERALDRHFARCRDDARCRAQLGDPRENLSALAARLRAAPQPVTFRDPVTGAQKTEDLTYAHLSGVMRLLSYAPQTAAMMPLGLHEAMQGRGDTLMAQAQLIFADLGEQIMQGMSLSVSCSEDAPVLRADPADAGTVLGTEFVDYLLAQCAVWPRGEVPETFRSPVRGDTPTLLLSGEFDPVTPPRYGDAVLYGLRDPAAASAGATPVLSNARHLVLRGQGHNALVVGCTPRLAARFIDTADATALDASCLDGLAYVPPFTGFHGWDP